MADLTPFPAPIGDRRHCRRLRPAGRNRPRIHIPSEAETRAIRIVAKHYATMYSKSPDSLEAARLPDGGWTVEATSILNPEPGGYRSVDTFRVDADWQCHWISLRAGGVF
jgi:hypothetical protein